VYQVVSEIMNSTMRTINQNKNFQHKTFFEKEYSNWTEFQAIIKSTNQSDAKYTNITRII